MKIIRNYKNIKCYTISCGKKADICIETNVYNGDIYFCFDCYNKYVDTFDKEFRKNEKRNK